MNSFDRFTAYYKIIGANNHGKYPYKLELNTLANNNEEFNEAPICGPGGLYFCRIEYIFEYFGYGNKVCILTIPDNAQVVKVYNKYKADQIYIEKIMEINNDTIKYLIQCGADIIANGNRAMNCAIHIGNLEMVKLFVGYGVDITADYNYAIRLALARGHLEIANYLDRCGADIVMAEPLDNNYM